MTTRTNSIFVGDGAIVRFIERLSNRDSISVKISKEEKIKQLEEVIVGLEQEVKKQICLKNALLEESSGQETLLEASLLRVRREKQHLDIQLKAVAEQSRQRQRKLTLLERKMSDLKLENHDLKTEIEVLRNMIPYLDYLTEQRQT
ncbi:MAG: hypothetical protein CME55_00275 [Halieaceae bacterium]|nr:hypothetical protein [Halieaceae bacterium]|tara:strand:- start:2998 stop:3435 length:438 start_codon:yes stop_codon:yes gene_type:complete